MLRTDHGKACPTSVLTGVTVPTRTRMPVLAASRRNEFVHLGYLPVFVPLLRDLTDRLALSARPSRADACSSSTGR